MGLRRQRGTEGEFGGGIKELECSTTPIGRTLIQAHCIDVLQACWHPDQTNILAIFTSDGGLRIFSLTQPSIPQLSLRVCSNPPLSYYTLNEDDGTVVSFYLTSSSIFLLNDRLDLKTVKLKEGSEPSLPLKMFPLNEDNYSGNGCGLLLLQTTPPIVVIAVDDGKLLHCVYLKEEIEEVSKL